MTDKEKKDIFKLQVLLNAYKEIQNEESQDATSDLYEELKQAGWNILHENPGTECGDWIAMLIEQYPTEVVDALGTNPFEVEAELSNLWDCSDFEDEETGECHSFATWSEYFANERSVELYDLLADARREIRRLETFCGERR